MWEPYVDDMMTSNVWHVPGADVDLIVDTANGVGPLVPHVEPLTAGKPLIAFATHGHFDHVGGLHEFADRRVHAADADQTREPFGMRLRREDFSEGTEEMYAYYGVPIPEVALRAVPAADFDLAGWVTPGAVATMLLEEGDTIDLGTRTFTVVHTPGHTPGSACLFDEHDGTLFTGDAVYVDAALSWDDDTVMEASLRRLAGLDARIAHAGHERSFDMAELRATVDAWVARLGA
ncbi:MAG TPA: MBL fold metallo-hydrolase [Actinomycetota bacterium]|nr:MBL fold metallo-hydrolase [Actinomycetota bacterium]